jgi:hypothetical protein
MVTKCLSLLLIGLALTCSAGQNESQTPAMIFNLAGKEWRLRFKDETNSAKLQEYLTQNENINKWTELLTLQRFKYKFAKEVTPHFFAEKEITSLKEKCPDCMTAVVDASPEETIMEFRVLAPVDKQQDELQRIIKKPDGQIVILHYAVKKNDMGEAERAKWLAALKSVNLNDW